MTEMEKQVMFRMAVKLVEYGIIEQDKEAEKSGAVVSVKQPDKRK